MKKNIKIAFSILMLISIICMFLPIATFEDNTAASMADKIAKQEDKLNGQQSQLTRWIEGGKKTEAEIEKQRAKVQKEQDALDALIAERDAKASANASGISYSFLPKVFPLTDIQKEVNVQYAVLKNAKVELDNCRNNVNTATAALIEENAKEAPDTAKVADLEAKLTAAETAFAAQEAKVNDEDAKLSQLYKQQNKLAEEEPNGQFNIDMKVVNDGNNVYPIDLSAYQVMLWIILICYVLTLALVWFGGDKLNSKFYTFSSFVHLVGIVLSFYCVARLVGIPVMLPYSNAKLVMPVVATLLVASIVAFSLHVTSVQNTKRSMIYVFCTLLSVMALLPFWIMIVNATRNSQAIQQGISLIPGTSIANNWNVIAKQKSFDVVNGFKNSVIISFGSTILSVYFSALTAYGFEVYDFKGKKFLWAIVMAIIMIPGQVTGTGFFMFMYQIGMVNNRLALIIPAIAAASTVFFFRQYLQANFQKSLVEASRIDGAGEFYTYNKIIMPIMIPAMATMGIMAVIGSWNNYLTPLMLLPDKTKHTLPLLVYALRGDIYRTEYGSIYLGLTLTALPLIIVYFALSKYIIAGVAVGGVKE